MTQIEAAKAIIKNKGCYNGAVTCRDCPCNNYSDEGTNACATFPSFDDSSVKLDWVKSWLRKNDPETKIKSLSTAGTDMITQLEMEIAIRQKMIDSIKEGAEMKDGKYVIRTWKDMEAAYGLTKEGNIKTPVLFTKDMERYMPPDRVITIDEGMCAGYYITDDMIECAVEEDRVEVQDMDSKIAALAEWLVLSLSNLCTDRDVLTAEINAKQEVLDKVKAMMGEGK